MEKKSVGKNIWASEEEEVTGGQNELHNEEFRNMRSPSHIIWVTNEGVDICDLRSTS
jgi:hypothetical protein